MSFCAELSAQRIFPRRNCLFGAQRRFFGADIRVKSGEISRNSTYLEEAEGAEELTWEAQSVKVASVMG
jgi:hypothetical protein